MSLQKPNDKMFFLAKKWLDGNITEQEKAEFDQWYNSFDDTYHEIDSEENEPLLEKRLQESIFSKAGIHQTLKVQRTFPLYRIAAAAAVLFILATGTYFILRYRDQQEQLVLSRHILPGTNKAVLTLSDGKQVVLNAVKNGELAVQGNIHISRTASGRIIYNADATAEKNEVNTDSYNTITIPNGGQYQLTLADGTKVWLNAGSSLKYPVAFTGAERNVELIGEAYFEVAKNKYMPFKVHSGKQTVEVLGTHFNISAYADDDQIRTTLLEGSVKVSAGRAFIIIKPGSQARTTKDSEAITAFTPVDAGEVIAWKNGLFQFKDADVQTVMKALSRWYNVRVTYDGAVTSKRFSGKIYRNVNVAQVMEILKYSGINLRIEKTGTDNSQNQIVVTP